eukprot:CAMPEP_0204517288 /NCGR_PEP_ID=MMETSP0661-20131031/3591_1 /ASSEMBLY_ACC=CAM_ASM_000606 /TAXON_ID=109239 /ORGANISM="Alexandrium margalefi, Strain AMGDE01CS-322" /LENGTH=164 /DNA_ID=CAMNT_0051522683 /DNA_START=107 /DNA_END=601 /DNA_ORIENTATION=-
MPRGQTWEVVGGGRLGVIVTEGEDRASGELRQRLPAGARLEEVAVVGERLHFKRLSGGGPEFGWVTTTNRGRDLVVREGATPRVPVEEPFPFAFDESKHTSGATPLAGWPSLPQEPRREPSPRPLPRPIVANEDDDPQYVSKEMAFVIKQLVNGNHSGEFHFFG